MNGMELKLRRIRTRIPQYILAAKVGISQSALSAFENERQPLTPEMAQAIGKAIDRFKIRSAQ